MTLLRNKFKKKRKEENVCVFGTIVKIFGHIQYLLPVRLPVWRPGCAITSVNALRLQYNLYMLLTFTIGRTLFKKKSISFIVRLREHTEEFYYLMVYSFKIVFVYFNDNILLQTKRN